MTFKEAPYSLYVTGCIRTLKLYFNYFFENVKSCIVNIESVYTFIAE